MQKQLHFRGERQNGIVEENISEKFLFLFGRTNLFNQDVCQAALYRIEESDHIDNIFSLGKRIEIWLVFPFCLWFHGLRLFDSDQVAKAWLLWSRFQTLH